MSSKSIVDQIRHYQKDIERCPENSERMIRCIQRLYVLPVLVQHLQETGVGRSVNSLRKYNGDVGEAAKALVTKWKAMVAAEESDDGGSAPLKESSDDNKKPPSYQTPTENGTKVKEEKAVKHDSSRHSGHKRSHSSSDRTEKKSVSSADRDKKSSSDKADKGKHDSKHSKEHILDRNAKKSSSKDSRKSKETTEDDSDHSPSRKKRKKNCVKERRRREIQDSDKSSDEESTHESSDRVHPDLSDDGDLRGPEESGEDREAAITSEKETSSEEESSDQKHQKDKTRSSEHHKSRSSSHGSSSKHKEKNHHTEGKRDHKKSSSSKSSQDLDMMIRENEKRVKKEKFEAANDSGGSTPKLSSSLSKHKEKTVKVKVETNNDGIDAGSGFSFGDALAGLDSAPKKKKKFAKDDSPVKSSSSSSSQNKSSSSHSHKSSKSSSSSSKDQSSSSSVKKSSSSSSMKDKHSDTLMPDLLKKPIKMENLEIDINSTLPEINPNYRPLPHVPENVRRNSTKSVTNEEEMFNMMMNKNQRTKVFSGGKSSYNTQVPSLYDLCIKLLYDNIDGLEFTGGVPYDLLKPLLEKLNPDQLFVLEHYNSYLIEDTGTLWEFHCKKDFRSQRRQDMESWRELYIRCMEEREEKLKALTQNISQSIAASTPVRKAKLAYVDSAVKPPRNIAKKQAKYGTGDASPTMKTHSAEKRLILNKAVVGGNDPSTAATTTVPPPPQTSAPRANWSTPVPVAPNKKRKAPLMAKALQLIKGTNRFKR